MANIAKTYTFVNGQPTDGTQVNKNFDDIIAGVGDISAAGHALIGDANAAAQIATLGAVATGDSRLSDARVASDVSAWAKAGTKPAYTADDVNAVSRNRGTVTNFNTALTDGEYLVNGLSVPNAPYTGGIYAKLRVLVSDGTTHDNSSNWIWQYVDDTGGKVYYRYKMNSGEWNGWQQIITNAVPNTDARLSNARPASDVSAWAKAPSKPSYTAAEVGTRKIAIGSVTLNVSTDTVVTHGLGTTPSFVLATMGNQLCFFNTVTSTTFKITDHVANTVTWLAVA